MAAISTLATLFDADEGLFTGQYTISDGVLTVGTGSYNNATSSLMYSIVGSSITFDIAQFATDTSSLIGLKRTTDPENDWLAYLMYQGTNIYFMHAGGGGFSTAYSYSTMRYIRISESAGIMYFHTSPDLSTWTLRNSFTPSGIVTDVNVIAKHTFTPGGSPIIINAINPEAFVATSVVLIPSSTSVNIGNTVQLSATAYNSIGTTVPASFSWDTSNSLVATVSSTGVVTGVSRGTAIITATDAGSGLSDTATITVVDIKIHGVQSITGISSITF